MKNVAGISGTNNEMETNVKNKMTAASK